MTHQSEAPQPNQPLTPGERAALDAEVSNLFEELARLMGTTNDNLAAAITASEEDETNPPTALVTPKGLTDSEAA